MLSIDKFAESAPGDFSSVEKKNLAKKLLQDLQKPNASKDLHHRMSFFMGPMNPDPNNTIIALALIQVFKEVEAYDKLPEGSLL